MVCEHNNVWIADIGSPARKHPLLVSDGNRFRSQANLTQIRRYQSSAGDPNLLESSPGRYGELPALDQLIVQEITGEQPQTVAAHLGDRSVGVAIVHEPQLRIEFVSGHLAGPHHPQQPVPSNTGVAVAERSNCFGAQILHPVWIINDDEVVAGGMTLGERVPEQSAHLSLPARFNNSLSRRFP